MSYLLLLGAAAVCAAGLYEWKRAFNREVEEHAREKRRREKIRECQRQQAQEQWLKEYEARERRKRADLERVPSSDWTDFLSSND